MQNSKIVSTNGEKFILTKFLRTFVLQKFVVADFVLFTMLSIWLIYLFYYFFPYNTFTFLLFLYFSITFRINQFSENILKLCKMIHSLDFLPNSFVSWTIFGRFVHLKCKSFKYCLIVKLCAKIFHL